MIKKVDFLPHKPDMPCGIAMTSAEIDLFFAAPGKIKDEQNNVLLLRDLLAC